MSAKALLEGSRMGGSFQNCYLAGINVPVFNDGIDEKLNFGIKYCEVNNLWRQFGALLASCGMLPVHEITAVRSAFSENQDHDRRLAAEKPDCARKNHAELQS